MNEEIKKEFNKVWQKISDLEKKNSKNLEKSTTMSCDSDILFDIDGEELTILTVFGEKTEEKVQNVVLLALLGYKEKLNKEKVLASELRRNVSINRIPIENFGTYINKLIPQSILRIGKIGSTKMSYKLTNFGIAKAKEIKKRILKNEQSK